MIKVSKIKSWAMHSSSSLARPFSANVNSAKNYFHSKYNTYSTRGDGYVYFYQIEKFNMKKKNTKKKQTSAYGFTVPKRQVVQTKEVRLTVFRFKRENIIKSKQNARSFYVELKF